MSGDSSMHANQAEDAKKNQGKVSGVIRRKTTGVVAFFTGRSLQFPGTSLLQRRFALEFKTEANSKVQV